MESFEKFSSFSELLGSLPSIPQYLRNRPTGPHGKTTAGLSPVPAEFTNWREEQRAWRETAILFDQSHHMPELFVKGPEARRLLSDLAVNNLDNLRPGIAKQFVGCNHQGQIIAESILHDLGGETFELISGKPVQNWVRYNAETGGYDVTVERDENTSDNASGRRRNFRFQLDGPKAGEIFREVLDGAVVDIKFFHTARATIAGVDVMVLRHGMAGHHGVEISGPYERGDEVLASILQAGAQHGLRRGGTKAYFSTPVESGWIGASLPAVYSSPELEAYREWLPADGWEGKYQLGGSFVSENVEDYYVTPYDMNYDRLVHFDHDFVGRDALRELSQSPRRRKVTLVWNSDDVRRVLNSLLEPGLKYKYIDMPASDYGLAQADEVRTLGGDFVGLSAYCGYSINESKMLSLGMIAPEFAEVGTEVVLTWGEPDGGTRKNAVERHVQTPIRATVAPVPYSKDVARLKNAAITSSSRS